MGVEVPQLVGVAVTDAQRVASPSGLSVHHVDADSGGRLIQEQDPTAGQAVAFGSVVLVYTRGSTAGPGPEPEPPQQTVPDVTRADNENEACEILEGAGFECQVEPPRPDGAPLGTVDRQVPRGGNRAPEHSTVTVFVRVIPVPDVVDQDEDDACDAIDHEFVCSVDPDNDDGQAPGIVTAQTPASGTLIRPGSTVTISVHRRLRPMPAPSVQDLHVDDACEIILEAGFTCDRQPWQGDGPDGRVMHQSPAAFEDATPGQPITVYVARDTGIDWLVVLGVVFGGLAVLVGVIGLPIWLRTRGRHP
jgi:serine/threonine-protein kinase